LSSSRRSRRNRREHRVFSVVTALLLNLFPDPAPESVDRPLALGLRGPTSRRTVAVARQVHRTSRRESIVLPRSPPSAGRVGNGDRPRRKRPFADPQLVEALTTFVSLSRMLAESTLDGPSAVAEKTCRGSPRRRLSTSFLRRAFTGTELVGQSIVLNASRIQGFYPTVRSRSVCSPRRLGLNSEIMPTVSSKQNMDLCRLPLSHSAPMRDRRATRTTTSWRA